MGVEIQTEVCWGAGGVAGLAALTMVLRAWLGRRREYTEKVLQDHYQGDEADLVAGRAMMVKFAPEDQKDFARQCAREVTQEFRMKKGNR